MIGINYPTPQLLEFCERDAEMMKAWMIERGIAPPANIRLLKTGEATRAGIRAAFEDLARRTEPGEWDVLANQAVDGLFAQDGRFQGQVFAGTVVKNLPGARHETPDDLAREILGTREKIHRVVPRERWAKAVISYVTTE